MNILYLIGNGFDIAQGAKTSYPNFYDYLKTLNNPSKNITRLLEGLNSKENINWSDLESALGQFTDNFESEEEFEDFFFEIKDELTYYLTKEDSSFERKPAITEKYFKDLVQPDYYLTLREQQNLEKYFNLFLPQDKIINIVTYNYTDILEKSLPEIRKPHTLPSNRSNYYFGDFYKIHGDLSDVIIMGVDNKDQIANKNLSNSENICDFFVKPIDNYNLGTLRDNKVKNLIMTADLVVTMGISFGQTDNTWWSIIGELLIQKPNIKLIINEYIKDNLSKRKELLQRIKREKIQKYLLLFGIKESELDKHKSQIHIAINEGFLKPSLISNDNRKGR